MKENYFDEVDNKKIIESLMSAAAKPKRVPMLDALKTATSGEGWCCARIRRVQHIMFQDGTRMRAHFCPRCGKEL